MPVVRFRGCEYAALGGETLLDCLIRNRVTVANSCRAGVCQSCLMRVVEGTPNANAQRGLREAWKRRGLVLACQCEVGGDLSVSSPDEFTLTVPGHIREIVPIGEDILRVRIEPDLPFPCLPGQFVHVTASNGVSRPCSLANTATA